MPSWLRREPMSEGLMRRFLFERRSVSHQRIGTSLRMRGRLQRSEMRDTLRSELPKKLSFVRLRPDETPVQRNGGAFRIALRRRMRGAAHTNHLPDLLRGYLDAGHRFASKEGLRPSPAPEDQEKDNRQQSREKSNSADCAAASVSGYGTVRDYYRELLQHEHLRNGE